MKRRTDKGLIILLLLANVLFGYGGWYVGEQEGKERGYEEANSQNREMAFARAEAVVSDRYGSDLEVCETWLYVSEKELNKKRNQLNDCERAG